MLRLLSASILTCLLIGTALSCNRIKRKGKAVDKAATQTVAEKKADWGDKIIARYDAFEPDTKYNKKHFTEFFGFAPTEDVKNLYCHADEVEIDRVYQFAFDCDIATVKRITSQLQLTKQGKPDNFSSRLWHAFPWWNSATIEMIEPYQKKGKHETYWYLWYDTVKKKAYYFTFDM